jgi:nucleotide-binding universal stress UspA family protein
MGRPMYHRIVVGFDGFDSSHRALLEALRLAKLCGSQVLVTLVEEHLPKYSERHERDDGKSAR